MFEKMLTGGMRLEDVEASRRKGGFTLHVPNLTIEPGEVVAVTGESGSGKSTLLDVLAGIIPVSTGRVTVAGLDLRKGSARAQVRRGGLYLTQQGTAVEYLSVMENVLLSAGIAGTKADHGAARDAIAALGLGGGLENRLVAELSGGQRQRAGLASALYRKAPVIWADEPTSALDPENTRLVFDALRSLARDHGTSVVCVSHDIGSVTGFADRHLTVADGRITEQER